MQEQIAKLIDRFPDHERIIKALAGSNARFKDLLLDHHDVHQQLANPESSDDPGTRANLESRYKNLDEELVRLIQGSPMV